MKGQYDHLTVSTVLAHLTTQYTIEFSANSSDRIFQYWRHSATPLKARFSLLFPVLTPAQEKTAINLVYGSPKVWPSWTYDLNFAPIFPGPLVDDEQPDDPWVASDYKLQYHFPVVLDANLHFYVNLSTNAVIGCYSDRSFVLQDDSTPQGHYAVPYPLE